MSATDVPCGQVKPKVLQCGWVQVCAVRNLFVQKAFSPAHFLDHATFNCGSLESAAVRS